MVQRGLRFRIWQYIREARDLVCRLVIGIMAYGVVIIGLTKPPRTHQVGVSSLVSCSIHRVPSSLRRGMRSKPYTLNPKP